MRFKESCIQRFKPAIEAIQELQMNDNQEEPVLIAIDGKCGSGKTTLGNYLKETFGGNLFHMDDFFLQEYQRTNERLSEAGGNVDYERFACEVLEPVKKKEDVQYRRYDCMTGQILSAKRMKYQRLNIIEGSYSQHPYFKNPYQLQIFMEISKVCQIENIRRREGEAKLEKFINIWIPKEEKYFEEYKIKKGNIVISWK